MKIVYKHEKYLIYTLWATLHDINNTALALVISPNAF